jgi:hypothetical protein
MEPPREPEPPWLPASRPAPPPPVPVPPGPPPGGAPPGQGAQPSRPRFDWRRLTRSPRGTASLAVLAAALLLWPFAGFSWIPWLIGIGALLALRLLRLDGPVRGWDIPLACLAVVIGLMLSTSPWAWALAGSIGILLAGLVQLPRWRLAVVGAVLCAVSGIGFAVTTVQSAQQEAAAHARVQQESRANQGAPRPQGVLPLLLNRIARGSPGAVCDNLLAEPVRAPFAASTGAPDCETAVGALAAQITNVDGYAEADAPSRPTADGGLLIDACSMTWGSRPDAGPQLGRLTVGQIAPSRYVVVGFEPC